MKAEEITLPLGLQSKSKTISISLPQAELGKILFHDKNLSSDKTVSCASCHDSATSFTINHQFARGVNGNLGSANPPAIFNRFENGIQFWDGRASNLAMQAYGPLYDPNEMGNTKEEIEKYLISNSKYVDLFLKNYQTTPNTENMIQAIVEYQKTFLIGHSRFDLYKAGNIKALSAQEIRGMNLFFDKFKCQNCHSGDNFTNDSLEVRCYPKFFAELTPEEMAKLKKIKVPSLRNVEKTFPYLHDGNLKTLKDVVEFYNNTGIFERETKKVKRPISITAKDNADLVQFLKTLTEINYKK